MPRTHGAPLEKGERVLYGVRVNVTHNVDLPAEIPCGLVTDPERVWAYTIGGYPVVKKWLSYREEKLLGRPLSKDEVRYVQEMVRRIAAILLLGPALDANYQAVKANTYP